MPESKRKMASYRGEKLVLKFSKEKLNKVKLEFPGFSFSGMEGPLTSHLNKIEFFCYILKVNKFILLKWNFKMLPAKHR